MNKYSKFFYLLSITFCLGISLSNAQTSFASEEELKKQAAILFEEEKFAEASPLYSQLVSNYSKDPEFNYRLGVCMLFSLDDKEKPLPFLMFAASKPDVEKEVHFYLGKTYHLNYMFDDAIQEYTAYLKIASEKNKKKFDVQRQIEMCVNGKKLLNSLTDLKVMDKKEMNREDFFRSYDVSKIGGKLLVKPNEKEFKTALDIKKKEQSIIYLSKDKSQLYFSSYGEKGENEKDIYVIAKSAMGEWGKPESLSATINTKYDEDYPFLHPNGKVLYFSSKGHNSMGGFDIFKSTLNESTKEWGEPVNMDFPINTPDDDILYVTDSSEQEAYFSSARSSVSGKISVYHINVERRPLEVVIVSGHFVRNASEQALDAKITVKDLASNAIVGIHYSSPKDGSYSFELPNGGSFSFTVESSSFPTQSDVVIVPIQYEFKPMQQKITYDAVSSKMKIESNYGETSMDENYLFALNYIKNKSKLNVSLVDLTPASSTGKEEAGAGKLAVNQQQILPETQGEEKVLSNEDIVKIAHNDAEDVKKEAKELRDQADVAFVFANQKNELAESKSREAKDYISKASNTDDIEEKETYFDMADDASMEANLLNRETVSAFNLAKKLDAKAFKKQEEADLFVLYAGSLDSAVNAENPEEAMAQMAEQAKSLDELSKANGGPASIMDNLDYEAKAKDRELNIAIQSVADAKQDLETNKLMINNLKLSIDKENNEDLKIGMENQIAELNKDIESKTIELAKNEQDVITLKNDRNRILHEAEIVSAVIGKSKVENSESLNADLALIDKTRLEQEVNSISEDPALYGEMEEKADADDDDALFAGTSTSLAQTPELENKDETFSEDETFYASSNSETQTDSSSDMEASEEHEATLATTETGDAAAGKPKSNASDTQAGAIKTKASNTVSSAMDAPSEDPKQEAESNLVETRGGQTQNTSKGPSDSEGVTETETNDLSENELVFNDANPEGSFEEESSTSENASENSLNRSFETTPRTTQGSNGKESSNTNTTSSSDAGKRLPADLVKNNNSSNTLTLPDEESIGDGEVESLDNTDVEIAGKLQNENAERGGTNADLDNKDIASNASNPSRNAPPSKQAVAENSNRASTLNVDQVEEKGNVQEGSTEIEDLNSVTEGGGADGKNDEEQLDGSQDSKAPMANANALSDANKTSRQDQEQSNGQYNNPDLNGSEMQGKNKQEEGASSKGASMAASNKPPNGINVKNTDAVSPSSTLKTTSSATEEKKGDGPAAAKTTAQRKEMDVKTLSTAKTVTEQLVLVAAETNDPVFSNLNEENLSKLEALDEVESPVSRDLAKAELLHNWSKDIDAYLSKRKKLYDQTTDGPTKAMLMEEMNGILLSSQKINKLSEDRYQVVREAAVNGYKPVEKGVVVTKNSDSENGTRTEVKTEPKQEGTEIKTQAKQAAFTKINSEAGAENQAEIDTEAPISKVERINRDHANDLAVVDAIENEEDREKAKAGVMRMWKDEMEDYRRELQEEYSNETSIDKKKVLARKISEAQKIPTEEYVVSNISSLLPVTSVPSEGSDNYSANTSAFRLQEGEVFAFKNQSVYSQQQPIPINDLEQFEGIIYKVQIGAFSKAIPQDLFKGITPITGETTSKGYIRYTAGIFKNLSSANAVKTEIQSIGYKDAFIVAFQNGKRIPMSKANAIAAQNTDEPQKIGTDLLGQDKPLPRVNVQNKKGGEVVAQGQNTSNTGTKKTSYVTAEDLQKRFTDIGKGLPEEKVADLNAIVSTDIAEHNDAASLDGLYYTVQVGVFSNPVTADKLYHAQPLYTHTTADGKMVYSIGVYDNRLKADEAKSMANELGLSDAFVTVYHNGKRVSMNHAKQIELEGAAKLSDPNANKLPFVNPKEKSSGSTLATDQVGDTQIFASNYSENDIYKVQVGAFRYEVPVEIVNEFLKIASFGIENYKDENGLTIFTVGEFKNYDEANKVILKIREKGFEDAFIVAYRKGKKIPVSTSN